MDKMSLRPPPNSSTSYLVKYLINFIAIKQCYQMYRFHAFNITKCKEPSSSLYVATSLSDNKHRHVQNTF